MHTDRAVIRLNSERVAMSPFVDRQTPVKTLPSLAVGNESFTLVARAQVGMSEQEWLF